jgi:hypothetical protein
VNQPLSYSDAQTALRNVTANVREAERCYEQAVEQAAEAEATYRRVLAKTMRQLRAEGMPIGLAETCAKGDVADFSRDRDRAAGDLRLALETIENRRGERASLHRLIEWSAAHDRTNNAQREVK